MATWPQNSRLFIHSYTDTFDQATRFAARPSRIAEHVEHKIGATVWGHASTSSEIFVCSEEDTDTFHGAMDIESGKSIYHFDDNRSGEELALDPEGGVFQDIQRGKVLIYFVNRWDACFVYYRQGLNTSSRFV